MNMKKYLPFIAVLVVVAAVAGYLLTREGDEYGEEKTPTSQTTNNSSSDSSNNTNKQSASQDNSSSATTKAVSIENFAFSDSKITVKVGTKVTWTNKDSAPHTVTSDSGDTLKSDTLQNGDTYSVTFDKVGTFAYHCNIHPSMTGAVTVTE